MSFWSRLKTDTRFRNRVLLGVGAIAAATGGVLYLRRGAFRKGHILGYQTGYAEAQEDIAARLQSPPERYGDES